MGSHPEINLKKLPKKKLIDLVNELQTTVKQLKKEIVFSDYLISSLPGLFYMFGEDRKFTRWCRNLEMLTGYSPEEIKNLTPQELVSSDYAEDLNRKIDEIFTHGRGETVIPMLTRQGKTIPVYLSCVAAKLGDAAYVLGTGYDISDRLRVEEQLKASLKEKEELMAEMHHRVKNNLAVVSGLLSMQADLINDEKLTELLKLSVSRIHSIAIIHELLYQQADNASRIDFGVYTRRLIKHIADTYSGSKKISIRMRAASGQVYMGVNKAVPCALIVHELLTNAYKHAFKGRSKGKIRVSITRSDKTCSLIVRDDGVGFPLSSRKSSMGMALVNGLVRQTGGELAIRSAGEGYEGVKVTVTCPLQ